LGEPAGSPEYNYAKAETLVNIPVRLTRGRDGSTTGKHRAAEPHVDRVAQQLTLAQGGMVNVRPSSQGRLRGEAADHLFG